MARLGVVSTGRAKGPENVSNPNPASHSTGSPSLWFVRSDTDRTHYYMVSTDARGLLRCECKSAQYRRTPCKHQRAVAAGLVRPATVKAAKATSDRSGFDIDSLYSDGGASVARSVAQLRAVS